MLTKIYFALLGIAVLVMTFFTFYSYSWLNSIGSPAIAAENFSYYSNLGLTFLCISFAALVIFAGYIIWNTAKNLSIWLSFVYFAVFMILQTFWLALTFSAFKKANGLAETSFTMNPIVGAVIIVVAGVAVFFAQYIIHKSRAKVKGDEL